MNPNEIETRASELVKMTRAQRDRLDAVEDIVRAYFKLRPGAFQDDDCNYDLMAERVGKRILALFAEKRP